VLCSEPPVKKVLLAEAREIYSKLKQLWNTIFLPKLYDWFFDLFWIFLALSSLHRCGNAARWNSAVFKPYKNSSAGATAGNFADSPARVDQFTGIPISRYITIEDSEQVLRAIRLTPPMSQLT